MSAAAHGALATRAPRRAVADGLRRVHVGMIDAVVAGESLSHVAALAAQQLGGSVAIVLPGLDLAVIEPGSGDAALSAVRSYVSNGPRLDPVAVPDGLVAEVAVRSGEERLGAVALLDAEPGDQVADVLQLTALAALTAVTLMQDEGLTRRRGCASLLDDLRAHADQSPADLIARARRLGCDLREGAAALRVRPRPGSTERILATIEQESPGAVAAPRGQFVDALLPAAAQADPEAQARRLARRLRRDVPIGLAPFEAQITELDTALDVAALTLAFSEGESGVDPDELLAGSWRLLLRVAATDPRELDALVESTVGPVVSADRISNAALLDTLRIYLDSDASMRTTATAVFAHRHTVAERLQRIRVASGHDPRVPSGQEQLALGLKAMAVRDVAESLARSRLGGRY